MSTQESPLKASSEKRTDSARVLIIDNYDSFTYNIREALVRIGVDSVVYRNDEISIEQVETMSPTHVIISPGPGTPENESDVGVSRQIVRYAEKNRIAIFGICLGHQEIINYFGGNIVQTPQILHGKTSEIDLATYDKDLPHPSLFAGIESGFEAMRYHSLAADTETFPEELKITAKTRDGIIMAFQHQGNGEIGDELPIYGVQFHPESFSTPDGQKILENFLKADPEAYAKLKEQGIPEQQEDEDGDLRSPPTEILQAMDKCPQTTFRRFEFPCNLSPDTIYKRLHAMAGEDGHCYAFESLREDSDEPADRYSYFGTKPKFIVSACNNLLFLNDEPIDIEGASNPMCALESVIQKLYNDAKIANRENGENHPEQRLTGGLVGFSSYEAMQYLEPTALPEDALTPDDEKTFSYGYFEDGIMYDNQDNTYYYYTRGEDRRAIYEELLHEECTVESPIITPESEGMSSKDFVAMVEDVKKHLIRGETFQSVISRAEKYKIDGSLQPVYEQLRTNCPSGNMHAVKMGRVESIGSFPELILRIHNDEATTYQVAGTRRLADDESENLNTFNELVQDPKDVAEHSMLVDLVRNDLARFAVPGSVYIPDDGLMQRLDAGSVMHIASKVCARVNGTSKLHMLMSVLPMGTVSGAPKIRSMRIISELEKHQPRGLYAGSFGFIDISGNLESVVGLRTIMRNGSSLKIQAGGGIVMDSDPENEYQETVNKMQVVINAMEPFIPHF